MSNRFWRRAKGDSAVARVLAAYLSVCFVVAVAAPGLALSAGAGEPTATVEPTGTLEVSETPGELAEPQTSADAPSESGSALNAAAEQEPSGSAPDKAGRGTPESSTQGTEHELSAASVISGAGSNLDFTFEGVRKSSGWTTGNLQEYDEGEWVPYRVVIKNKDTSNSVAVPATTVELDHYMGAGIMYDRTRAWGTFTTSTEPKSSDSWYPSTTPATPASQDVPMNPAVYGTGAIITTTLSEGYLVIPPGQYGVLYFQAHLAVTAYWNTQSPSRSGAGLIPGSSGHGGLEIPGIGYKTVSLPSVPIPTASIEGVKFHDYDGDSVKDADEPPLPGWTITIEGGEPGFEIGTLSDVTDADGRYSFSPLPAGVFSLDEELQTDWMNTTDLPMGVTLDSGAHVSRDIGNRMVPKPAVDLTKTAVPESVPETGGDVTFTFTIANTGPVVFTVTSLTDTVFGDLMDEAKAAWVEDGNSLPITIPIGDAWSFEHTVHLAADDLVKHTNEATVAVVDNDGTAAEDQDDAAVDFTDVPPLITVTKTADPTHVPEGGDYVTFTVSVHNPGPEDVTLTSLIDDVFGDLASIAGTTITLPQTILIGDTYQGTFTVALKSDELVPHTNVVTAEAVDDEGTEVTATDEATVTFDDTPPLITVTKTAEPASVPETGGDVAFTIEVENTGAEPVWLTGAIDTVFGPIPAASFDKTYLGIGEVATCTFAEWLASDSLTVHTNVVTAEAVDNDGTAAEDQDDAAVDFTDVPPLITVTKTADPTHVPEGGDYVTFTVSVHNPGPEDVTLTSLIDDVFGDLASIAGTTITLPQTILIGDTYQGTFTVALKSDELVPHTNVVTATAEDDEGTEVTATDEATVTFDDTPPAITVTKTAEPASVPETGGDVAFTIEVENTGAEPVWLTGAIDTVFGPIPAASFDKTYLGIGEVATCTFAEWLASDSLTAHENVVTVAVVDNDGTAAEDQDDAAVDFTDVPPLITVTKTADPTHVPEGGDYVTFTVSVHNPGPEDVTLTSLIDDVFGDLASIAGTTITLPQTILIGDTYQGTFTVALKSDELVPHTNVVTAEAVDDEGTEVTATDEATVTFDDTPPAITVTKTAEPEHMTVPGGSFDYTATIENTGPEPVKVLLVTDNVFGVVYEWTEGDAEIWLEPGQSRGFEFSSEHTESGVYANTVTVVAVDNDGTEVSDAADVTVRVTNPDIDVEKSSNAPEGGVELGVATPVVYTYVVSNRGDVTLYSVVVRDDKLGLIGTIDELAPLEAVTLTADTVLSDGVTNVVTAVAHDEYGNEIRDDDSLTIESYMPFTELDLAITKSADRATAGPGDVVTYTIKYWNNGEAEAEGYTITDDFDERYVTLLNAGGGTVSGGVITWKPSGTLTAADGKQTIIYKVRINNTVSTGATNVDNVVVIADAADADDSNNTARARVRISEPFLPFTGAQLWLLAVVALLTGTAGLALRLANRKSA